MVLRMFRNLAFNHLVTYIFFKVKQIIPAPTLEEKGKITVPVRPPGPYAHKVTSLDSKEPKKAWTEDSHISDE